MNRELRAFSAACTFMTRIPTWRVVAHDVADLPASAVYFPLVGLLVGAAGAVVWWLASWLWSPWIAVLLAMAATIRLTGAFHEDALADSLDGFGGGWTREQVLHIMKDSRVGSYALVGMFVALLLKATLLVELTTMAALPVTGITGRWPAVVTAMLAAHVLARASSVALIGALPYVRSDDAATRASAGRPFVAGVSRARVILALLCAVMLSFVLLGSAVWIVLVATAAATALAARYFRARIGGITGDALGAANQVVELVVYLTLAASVQHGSFLQTVIRS